MRKGGRMDSTWYRLDNSAKLFPAVADKINSSVYRIGVVLKNPINEKFLQRAVDQLYEYYPMYMVRVKKGLFWNYLEPMSRPIQIEKDLNYPSAPFSMRDENNSIRIVYAHNRIAIEVFHILTDGTGALEFMKTLLYFYMKQYKEVDANGIRMKKEFDAKDYEDSYQSYSNNSSVKKTKLPLALHIVGKEFETYGNQAIHGLLSTQQLLKIARSYNVTITTLLSAVLTQAIIQNTPNPKHRAIIISVPINLRKTFESETLSNFFGVANIVANVDESMTFQEILDVCVKELTEELSLQSMQSIINNNVAYESIPGTKYVPLFIKNRVIDVAHSYISERSKTMTISNLGIVKLPPSIEEEVENFEVVLYPTETAPINATAISVGDVLTISFVSRISNNEVIQSFFKHLADLGADISVYANEWGQSYE